MRSQLRSLSSSTRIFHPIVAAQPAHPADAPAGALKIGRFLKIAFPFYRVMLAGARLMRKPFGGSHQSHPTTEYRGLHQALVRGSISNEFPNAL
jgi:hypothetical protein